MEIDKQLLKEINRDLKRDKIFNFLRRYKKHIFCIVLLLILVISSYLIYSYYLNNKAEKNSLTFAEAKNAIAVGKEEDARVLLDNLIKDGTKGYAFLAYMEQINILLKKGALPEAIKLLQEARRSINLPDYYKDYLDTVFFMTRLNNNEDIGILTEDLKEHLDKDSSFYFADLEMYASLLAIQKKYEDALKVYEEIIQAEKSPIDTKERAKRAKSLLLGYKK
ncbi:Tetratricopeptide repeat protein [Candidatus Hepatincolaceae symbiont of Richtersius coronifer]